MRTIDLVITCIIMVVLFALLLSLMTGTPFIACVVGIIQSALTIAARVIKEVLL